MPIRTRRRELRMFSSQPNARRFTLGLSAYDIIVKYQTAFLATRQLGAQV
jgi:hypothetical protein